ncbi:AsmA family protein [Sphingomonas koreensis]|nr:AsmA family protein [Sphingomonas koreensis]
MTARELVADRRFRWTAIGLLVVAIVLLIVVAMFPWGLLKPTIERRLSAAVGKPVTIASVERRDAFSFTPKIAIRGVRVPQPAWAGSGDLAVIDTATVRFNALAALTGHFSPTSIEASGLRIALVRDKDRRENWRFGSKRGGSGRLALDRLAITDGIVTYKDAVQQRSFTLQLAADATKGVRLAGSGAIAGHPVTLAAHAPPVAATGKPWPFTATIAGDAVGMAIKGTMDHPLDTGHMSLDMTTHASDLKLVDAIIEAGLFGTQPVKLAGHARHDGETWTLTDLHGTIGRSDVAGHAVVKKVDGRTRIDGAVVSNTLDFDDLASNAGLAKGRALEAAEGPKIVPNTRVNLAHVGDTDGRLTFEVRHIVSRKGPSTLAAAKGVVTIDHRLATLSPFTLRLTQGAITGKVTIDQRDGGPEPKVTIALDLNGGTVPALLGGGGEVSGSVSGRARLVGRGSTIREAVGASDGHIGAVARDGALPAKIASFLGLDVARGLTTDDDTRAGLRCAVLRLDMRGGRGAIDPMVIDTTRSQSRGSGAIVFPAETLAIRLIGAPKEKSVLRLPGALIVSGTVRAPSVQAQKGTKSIGNIFKAIGRSISGNEPPKATDADCAALAAKALG